MKIEGSATGLSREDLESKIRTARQADESLSRGQVVTGLVEAHFAKHPEIADELERRAKLAIEGSNAVPVGCDSIRVSVEVLEESDVAFSAIARQRMEE